MESHGKSTAVIGIIVALVIGGFVGWWIGDMHSNGNSDTSSKTNSVSAVSSKAADLRANLVAMGVEHMDQTYATVASTLNGSPSAKADGAALYQNGNDIGAAVGSVYGPDAEKTFDSVWKLHIDQFVAYAVASSQNDSAGKQAALDKIDSGYTHPLAAYLAKANPNLPEATLYKALKGHVDMTAVMIDDEASGNFTAAQKLRDQGAMHLKDLFSTLASGIVKQYPNKF